MRASPDRDEAQARIGNIVGALGSSRSILPHPSKRWLSVANDGRIRLNENISWINPCRIEPSLRRINMTAI
jgi:hypothetical protein